jgi:hypothetical protein
MGLRLAVALFLVGCGRYAFDPLHGDDSNGGGSGPDGGGPLGSAGSTTPWGLLASYTYGGQLRWALEVVADQLWVGGGFTGTVTYPTGTFTSAGIVDTLLLAYQGR